MIRTALILVCILFAGIITQAVFIHSVYPSAIAPDFVLILVVYLGIYVRSPLGIIGAFFLGLVSDFASGQILGPNAAGSVVACLLSMQLSNKIYAERGLALSVIGFIASIVKSLVFILMLTFYVPFTLSVFKMSQIVLIEALLTAALAPVLMAIINFFYARTPGNRGSREFRSKRWSH